jgi:hypothetical protein
MTTGEFLQRRGKGDEGNNEGIGFIRMHCVHLWRKHSETPLYNKCMLIKMKCVYLVTKLCNEIKDLYNSKC